MNIKTSNNLSALPETQELETQELETQELNLDALNRQQREAVMLTESPLLVIAGAGSGKTRVITYRIAHLIKNLNVSPSSILAVTFTNKAAGEMRDRVEKLTGLSARSMWVSTFHSAALRMLRRDRNALGKSRDFSIFDDGDSETLIKNILKELGIDPKKEKPAEFANTISRAKDELLEPDDWLEISRRPRADAEKMHEVYSRYEASLNKFNALDFGDLIFEAVKLLAVPEVLERYSGQFRYILVDEYQDTNTAQCTFIQKLASRHKNLCVVGDDDQSIYEWRGADRRNILQFENEYPDAKVIVLDQNYRSTQPILNAATSLISHNMRIRDKRLFTKTKGGIKPDVHGVANEYAEAEAIVAKIRENSKNDEKLSDHAIFFRVHAQSRVLEEMLSAYSIPYQLLSGVSFYQRKEIKDVSAYMKLIANNDDGVSFLRVINNPARGIGEASVEKIRTASNGKSLFETCKNVFDIDDLPNSTKLRVDRFVKTIEELTSYSKENNVADLLREILSATGYLSQYDPKDSEDEERIENVRELVSVAEEFQSEGEEPQLNSFLERTALATDVDKLDENADSVILSTLHSAKGLEFAHVYIAGCEETLLPHVHAYRQIDPKELEEERRLTYVGFTRAKKTLDIYYTSERRIYGNLVTNIPSRLIKEAELKAVDYSSAKNMRTRFTNSRFTQAKTKLPSLHSANSKKALPIHTEIVSMAHSTIESKTGIFSEGDKVSHRKFGDGEILYVCDSGSENETVQVKFSSGVKTLMTKYARLEK